MEATNTGYTIFAEKADCRIGARFEDRYGYDTHLAKADGWYQYDTHQDAHYFGVWVNIKSMQIFTYCEGDRSLGVYPSLEAFQSILDNMEGCYGSPPPAATAIEQDGSITHWYDIRPTSSNLNQLLASHESLYPLTDQSTQASTERG